MLTVNALNEGEGLIQTNWLEKVQHIARAPLYTRAARLIDLIKRNFFPPTFNYFGYL